MGLPAEERCEIRSKRTGRKNCPNPYGLIYYGKRICKEHWDKLAESKLKLMEALRVTEKCSDSGRESGPSQDPGQEPG